MTSQATRDKNLESILSTLRTKVVSPGAQSKIRSQVLSLFELEALRNQLPETGDENIPDDCSDPDELKFRRAFDFNGWNNMVALAAFRGVSQRRIVLDMAFEIGFLFEADYRRYLRQLESDSIILPSVFLHYADGDLHQNGKLVGSIQERRKNPTGMQTVLQMFQDQNWPSSITAPRKWDADQVTSTCRQLRSRFKGHVSFHERDGGKSILLQITNPEDEVTPN